MLIGWDQVADNPYPWEFGVPDDAALHRIEGLITHPGYPLPRERLRRMSQLKVVSTYGVGYDYIDVEAASELGILVTHTPNAVIAATAELGLSLVLASLRHLVAHDRLIRAGHSGHTPNPVFAHPLLAHDAAGQTIGIVGYGRIGQRLAHLLGLVGFPTLYTRAHGPIAGIDGYRTLDQLIAESDILVLTLPLTANTWHIMDAVRIAGMKAQAQLINIGRGACVDEEALVRALKERRIGGAALDVFEFEPRISDELTALDNVILSPHVGTTTWETRARMTREAVGNIVQALQGRPSNAVNLPSWTRSNPQPATS